ncbi:MAG: hypothetical protein HYX87_08365 [Chloroflexi bacterium]|nr:hypothetical protein [Chloroflexota bacterium]
MRQVDTTGALALADSKVITRAIAFNIRPDVHNGKAIILATTIDFGDGKAICGAWSVRAA